MLAWLNQNAPAVQALASIATVFVTILLAVITRRYVTLTQEMAQAAQKQQLAFHEQSAATEAAQLLTLIDVLIGSVSRFPDREEEAERIREVGLWKHGDVASLGSLSASVLGSGARAHDVIPKLNWLQKTAEEVQQTKREDGYAWQHFPWVRWRHELKDSRAALGSLRSATVHALGEIKSAQA